MVKLSLVKLSKLSGAHYYSGWVGWVALEEWKLRLTWAKVEVDVEAELGKNKYCELFLLTKPTFNF